MMFYHKIFSVLILISCYCLGHRVKRIIGGTRVIGRKGPYDAVRYMVGIGSMHGVPFYTAGFHADLKDTGVYGTINCGGALLTPAIIQTACHCLAAFDFLWLPRATRVNLHWESVRVVYIGINDRFGEPFSMLTRPPVKSQKFVVHKSCEKLPKTTQEAISFDFGYIKIDPSWIKGDIKVPTSNVMFAPVYEGKELSATYWNYLLNPPVCLNVGYGLVAEDGRASDFIRAGWTHLMYEYWCRPFTCLNMTDSEVEKYKTWVCSEEFPKYYQPPFKADSGGPLTCNNAYFGVVSGSLKQTSGSKSRRIGTYAALFFSGYANTAANRPKLMATVDGWNTEETYADKVKKVLHRLGFLSRRIKGGTQNHTNLVPNSIPRLLSLETSSEVSHTTSGPILVLFLIALHMI